MSNKGKLMEAEQTGSCPELRLVLVVLVMERLGIGGWGGLIAKGFLCGR
jgi:hypothetical protein